MEETRAAKYGRYLALFIKEFIATIPENQRINYRLRLLAELKKYSFKPKPKDQPKNAGCVRELENIVEGDFRDNPENLARLIKEGMHLMYQKNTAYRALTALRTNL